MSKYTDQEYLKKEQYKDASNLDARIEVHKRFSENKQGWASWVFDTYETLTVDIDEYRRNVMKLTEERKNIVDDINLFYRKHDLGTMMDFLRGFGDVGQYKSGSMEGGIVQQSGQQLEEKMRVKPPPPVEKLLPSIPPVAPLSQIKRPMKKIIEQAYKLQHQLDLKEIVQP